jgi:hypothetical protein
MFRESTVIVFRNMDQATIRIYDSKRARSMMSIRTQDSKRMTEVSTLVRNYRKF